MIEQNSSSEARSHPFSPPKPDDYCMVCAKRENHPNHSQPKPQDVPEILEAVERRWIDHNPDAPEMTVAQATTAIEALIAKARIDELEKHMSRLNVGIIMTKDEVQQRIAQLRNPKGKEND